MAWLRLDDRFTKHPKVLKLKRVDRWTWLEILEYCAAYRTGGHVPDAIADVLPHATPALIKQCIAAGLLDAEEHGWNVHDWDVYNPKDPAHAERQRRYRQRQRDGNRRLQLDSGEQRYVHHDHFRQQRDGQRNG